MSIRLRLTLWYVVLLGVILVVFSGALYAVVTYSSLNEVDRTLQARAAEVQNGATTALELQSEPVFAFRRGSVRFLPAADVFVTPGVFVQVSRADGTPITRSDNLGDQTLVLTSGAQDRVNQGDSFYTNLTIEGAALRAFVSPLRFRNQIIGIIEVAQSLQPVYDSSRRLATLLGGGIVLSLALASLIGALLARNALAPIARVTQTAEGITRAGDLTRRLDAPRAQDEVGQLVGTFNEMLGRIEVLFRSQQRFLSDVSHELRSPLTAIRGNVDLLRRGAIDNRDERQQMLAAIDSETERMKRLVDDLLLLARADEGVKFQTQRVELDTILLDVYRQARVMSDGVKVVLGNEDQAQVLGDPDRLKQLFLNLSDNGIKYTPSGGEVTLSLERDSEWVRVSVSDTGIGIPREDLPKIFDRFYRVDKSRTRESTNGKGGGTGLGLAIVKWIAEAHGGRIEVFSEVGKGSTFTVWLPLAKDEARN